MIPDRQINPDSFYEGNYCRIREVKQKPNYAWRLYRKANPTYGKVESETFEEYIKRVIEWNDQLFIKFNSENK